MVEAAVKPTGLIAAVALLAVLGGAVWYTNKNPKPADTKTPEAPKILSLAEDSIEGIRLVKANAEPLVISKSGDGWKIEGEKPIRADDDAIHGILSTISAMTGERVIDDNPADLKPFGLDAPAFEADFTAKSGAVTKLLIGSDTPSGASTYVKLGDKPRVFTMLATSKATFDKSVSDLRDKRMLTFVQDKVKSITLTPPTGTPVEFTRGSEATDWQITKPKVWRADSLQVDDFMRRLRDAKMDLTGDTSKFAADFASGVKAGAATVTDQFSTHSIEVHKAKDGNTYFAKSSDVDGVFKLSGDLGEGMNKSADDFRNKKLFDFGFNDPFKVEISGKLYQKAQDKWRAAGAEYDPGSIQAAIDKLRDIAATKFADKTAGMPVATLAVTSGNNKLEKVTVTKQGDDVYAMRDGDPSVYVLDAKAWDDVQKTIAAIKVAEAPNPDNKKK